MRLERGRSTNPSPHVLSALARALRLTTAEREHLFVLADEAVPSLGQVCDHVQRHPGLKRHR
ncbi:helix-turn-helix transcriptional regulator [Streptomyces sp. NPDC021056]|uniref:helix-turn-helix domain-containing protein n=1 Tax=Streptomyces sp. NPDC021056 TaxID=3155012 RepID=UPI0033FA5505